MVLRRSHHDRVHIDTGNTDQSCIQTAIRYDLLYLDDYFTTGIVSSLSLSQGLCIYAFFFNAS